MDIVNHIEKHVGIIDQGWGDNRSKDNLQVISIPNTPYDSITTYLTLGLSNHELRLSDDKMVRQELVFSDSNLSSSLIAKYLLSIGEHILNHHKALLRGEVIHNTEEMSQKLGFDATYCAIPVLFDDEFATFANSEPPTVFVWAIPIFINEIKYIADNGWESFEDLLENQNPDLCLSNRDSVV